MEERLDDAINVLRNHAESQLGLTFNEYADLGVPPPTIHTPTQNTGILFLLIAVELDESNQNSKKLHAILTLKFPLFCVPA